MIKEMKNKNKHNDENKNTKKKKKKKKNYRDDHRYHNNVFLLLHLSNKTMLPTPEYHPASTAHGLGSQKQPKSKRLPWSWILSEFFQEVLGCNRYDRYERLNAL